MIKLSDNVYTFNVSTPDKCTKVIVARWVGDNVDEIRNTFPEDIKLPQIGCRTNQLIYQMNNKRCFLPKNNFIVFDSKEYRYYQLDHLTLEECLEIIEKKEAERIQGVSVSEPSKEAKKYYKTSVLFDAVQWRGDNLDSVNKLCQKLGHRLNRIILEGSDNCISIYTDFSKVLVEPSDYLVYTGADSSNCLLVYSEENFANFYRLA